MLTENRWQELKILCKQLDLKLNDLSLLHQALTHTSYANESKNPSVKHNERLEFLGDAVLDLAIGEYLYNKYPQLPEGELTKARAMVVCEPTLAHRASNLRLGDYLLLGKGEACSGGRERISILADSLEAVIGAIFLDGGFEKAAAFTVNQLKDALLMVDRGEYVKDYKTLLQEVVQKTGESKIGYELIQESGPDHAKTFSIAVMVNNQRLGIGLGKSKKEAEQQAARQALIKLKIIK